MPYILHIKLETARYALHTIPTSPKDSTAEVYYSQSEKSKRHLPGSVKYSRGPEYDSPSKAGNKQTSVEVKVEKEIATPTGEVAADNMPVSPTDKCELPVPTKNVLDSASESAYHGKKNERCTRAKVILTEAGGGAAGRTSVFFSRHSAGGGILWRHSASRPMGCRASSLTVFFTPCGTQGVAFR